MLMLLGSWWHRGRRVLQRGERERERERERWCNHHVRWLGV
jgi:hypothetical protein